MHDEAHEFVAAALRRRRPRRPLRVLEYGGRDVNGSIRDLFPDAKFVAVDIAEGPGVDVVDDAAVWGPRGHESWPFDVVVCCETFEHTPDWPQIVAKTREALRGGGRLIVTAACDPREPHSAVDGGPVRDGEWYENVDPTRLREVVEAAGFDDVHVRRHKRGDVYLSGWAS